MRQPLLSTYFVRQREFRVRPASVLIFIVLALAAWGAAMAAHSAFPLPTTASWAFRSLITLVIDLIVIYVSLRLLRQNGLPAQALGLPVSGITMADILLGALIGIVSVAVIAALLYLSVPYHFVPGPMGGAQIARESISYLLGNTLEELMFRGFLFIIFCQLTGWRIAAVIMALPFGLFHLQITGLNMAGLKTVVTTACFSFVFSLSFVLLRSLWGAISVHVVSNILLHAVTGLDGDGKSLLTPFFEKEVTNGYHAGFGIVIISAAIVSGLLFLLIVRTNKRPEQIHPTVS